MHYESKLSLPATADIACEPHNRHNFHRQTNLRRRDDDFFCVLGGFLRPNGNFSRPTATFLSRLFTEQRQFFRAMAFYDSRVSFSDQLWFFKAMATFSDSTATYPKPMRTFF